MEKVKERKDVSEADKKRAEKEYGKVSYADEKNKKYPLSDEKKIRSAWSYINMPRNADKYSAEDVKAIKAKIVAAWKAKIDKAGPPSEEKKAEKVKYFSSIAPLQKVQEGDNGELYVEGFLAKTGIPDKTPIIPELMDEEKSAPNFIDWVEKTKQMSGGKSLFNVREMHKAVAAGRGVDFKHIEGEGFWGKAEVIDEGTKEKVRKGVITSFSVGGSYGWKENIGGVLHYEAKPIEVSFVDVGMIPGTEFQYVKADGASEMRKFATIAEPLTKAQEFIKAYSPLLMNPDYARQESWDINRAAHVMAEAAMLMQSEADEPEDAKKIAAILKWIQHFIAGEIEEMEMAATGEMPDELETESEASDENEEVEEEADEQPETAEMGETEAEKVATPDMTKTFTEEELTQKVTEIVKRVMAESGSVEKTQIAEMQKSLSGYAALEKAFKDQKDQFTKSVGLIAADTAKLAKAHNEMVEAINTMQKTVDSYGPVVMMPAPVSNGQDLDDVRVLKSLIAKENNPMLKQAYQARLTELEIRNTKPLADIDNINK